MQKTPERPRVVILGAGFGGLTAAKAMASFADVTQVDRHKAIVEVKNFRLVGIPAWYAWLFLHLFYLLGGRNKIGTLADWTWNFLTFDRGNRHIMDSM